MEFLRELFSEREKLEGLISSILKITMKIMHLMTDCKIMQQFMEIPALVHEVWVYFLKHTFTTAITSSVKMRSLQCDRKLKI